MEHRTEVLLLAVGLDRHESKREGGNERRQVATPWFHVIFPRFRFQLLQVVCFFWDSLFLWISLL
jgi:hypothetical protein